MDRETKVEVEEKRLQELVNSHLLHSPPEERFDRLTRMATKLFSLDGCLLSFIDDKTQWIKSQQGFNAAEISLKNSICAHTLLLDQALIIEDTKLDSRFAKNALVTGSPNIRFYAGAPLVGPNDFNIGSLCIFDKKPRQFSDEEKKSLIDLSQLFQNEINASYEQTDEQPPPGDESTLQAIIDNVIDGIITINDKGIIEKINPAAIKIFGYSQEEVVGNNIKMLMPDPYRDSHDDYLKNNKESGQAKIIGVGREILGERKDGSTFPMELSVSEIKRNGKLSFTGIVRDISLKKKEGELLAKYANIIKTSNDPIVTHTPDGCITSWNVAAEEMLGYKEEEIIEKNYSLLVPDSAKSEYETFYEKLDGGEAIDNFETQRLAKSGEIIDVSISISPIMNEYGILQETSLIFRDIGEQKEWTKQLVLTKEQAEKASQSKTQFVANMSHEIRTPLNAILGMSQIIGKTKLTIEQNNYLDMIQSSGKALLDIINDILDFSQVETGQLQLSNSNFNLDDLMRSVANVMSVNAGDKNLELVIDIDTKAKRFFYGDHQRIHQVLINLVSNAIKFTDSGEVVVRVQTFELCKNELSLNFSVTDSGKGMSEEQKEKLFTAFTKADTAITRGYTGSGLGLMITKRFIELMKGNININSAVGRGTEVVIDIPIQRWQGKNQEKEYGSDLKDLHILVVDDNDSSRSAITHGIESIGWRVDVLASAHDLQGWLEEKYEQGIRYDMLLLDTTLPGEDSLSAVDKIEKDFDNYELPTVLMVNAFSQDKLLYLQSPLNKHNVLIKPITLSSLFDFACEKILKKYTRTNSAYLENSGNSLDGINILLVEDNEMNQMVAQCMLEDLGATLDVAGNGQEAVDKLKSKNTGYDIVLMDVQMPVMDGFAATKIIRSDLNLSIPVLALSAGVLDSERENCTAAGMNDFIAKPIDVDQLYTTIDQQLSTFSSRAGPPN